MDDTIQIQILNFIFHAFQYFVEIGSGKGRDSNGKHLWLTACKLPGTHLRPEVQFSNCFVYLVFGDRKSTRLNSSHVAISYAVFCLKKKKKNKDIISIVVKMYVD